MSFNPKSRSFRRLVVPVALLLALTAANGYAQFCDLEIVVSDTIGYPGQDNSIISVYCSNYADTIAGFELWLILDRPDRLVFQTDLDTIITEIEWACRTYAGQQCIDSVQVSPYWICQQYNGSQCIDSAQFTGFWRCLQKIGDSCIDSTFEYGVDWITVDTVEAQVGNLDTTGTLISGWEYLQTRSFSLSGWDMKITAQANLLGGPNVRGFGPQDKSKPLLKLRGDIFNIPGSETERTVKIMIQKYSLDNFGFSDENGDLIGVYPDTIPDTNWFRCQQWADPPQNTICMLYQEVSGPPSDSIHVSNVVIGRLDTAAVCTTDGSLTILMGVCGDVNNNTLINIQDITYLINFLYKGGPEPPNPFLADLNGRVGINIQDVTYLINFLYKGGPDPICL